MDGAAKTRYPSPPTSMTSASAVIAPTTPSTDAINGGSAGSGRGALGGALRLALGGLLADECLANGALVAGRTALDRLDGRAVHDGRRTGGGGCRGIGAPHRDRQRVGG